MMSSTGKTLVTGATGFVGRVLVDNFSRENVRLVRRGAGERDTLFDTVSVPEIGPTTDWAEALDGIDTIVHLAAQVHLLRANAAQRRAFHAINTLGTEQLAASAAKRNVKRFIFLSTIKVNGESTSDKPFSPHDVPAPVDPYGVSKYQAEQKLFDIARTSNMQVFVIRPPLVYGPFVRANFLRMMHWVYRGVPLPLARIQNRRSLISVWNLCDLVMHCVRAPISESSLLLASDDEDLSTPELIRRLSIVLNRPNRLFSFPLIPLIAAATVLGKRAEISRLCESLAVDIHETKRLLNWKPPLSVDEGLARTADWFLANAVGR